MNVEERVRRALTADGQAVRVPAPPTVAGLAGRRRVRGWPVAVTASLVAVVLVAVLVAGLSRPFGLRIDSVLGADGPPTTVSFNPAGPDVFASGQLEPVAWVAAAQAQGSLSCVGVQMHRSEGTNSSVGCRMLGPSPIEVGAIQSHDSVVVVAGWVSDRVARLVWQRPDGAVDLALREHAGIGPRLFADAAKVEQPSTILQAYDTNGNPIGGAGISAVPDEPTGPSPRS